VKIPFTKYHGTGNDFIIVDNRILQWNPRQEEVFRMCNRHLGIGADGMMLLSDHPDYDFYMTYFNSDGKESTMCGNGGRCMIVFAQSLGLIGSKAHFIATDGEHVGNISMNETSRIIRLKMKDVRVEKIEYDHFYLNTGSPHYVIFSRDVRALDVITEARKIRFSEEFKKEGTNVDFVEVRNDSLFVRTYERGVEDETLSCGTGVIAAVLAVAIKNPMEQNKTKVQTLGGELSVSFHKEGNSFTDIWLSGPATFVYNGVVDI